jgi:hypothetical protein
MSKATYFTGQPVFTQLLSLIPRKIVDSTAKQHAANRYCKRFMAYDHLISMLYAGFFGAQSIRELVTGLQAYGINKANHLGLMAFPRRSTLSDANKRRPAAFFGALYQQLYQLHYGLPDSRKTSIHEDLYIIDSTTVHLFNSVMRGAGVAGANGKKKGGAKAHVLLNAKHDLPAFVVLSEAKEHDLIFLAQAPVPDNSTVVFDKGYAKYSQYLAWGKRNIRWITRLKNDAYVVVLNNLPVCEEFYNQGVRSDKLVELGRPSNRKVTQQIKARLITFFDAEKNRDFNFITNDMVSDPQVIAALYKRRWQIELLFKRIKQRYPLKYFLGDNPNAIMIQIWAALICDLLVKIIQDQVNKYRKQTKSSYAGVAGMIKHHLMSYLNLVEFLLNPEKVLSKYKPPTPQISLFENGASP